MGKQKPNPLDAATLAKFLERATDLHGKGRFEEAMRLYAHVESNNPDELSAPYFLAIIDLETGELGRALDRFNSSPAKRLNRSKLRLHLRSRSANLASGNWPPTAIAAP